MTTASTYDVARMARPRGLDDPAWTALRPLAIALFHPRSSDHRPGVTARIGHSGERIHLRFAVDDRFVLSRQTELNAPVCTDSCVEFFVEPLPGLGYFNFEVNAGGTVHCSHIEDPTPIPGGFKKMDFLTRQELAEVGIATTLPRVIDPERPDAVSWQLALDIPVTVLAKRLRRELAPSGTWRANLYKCADHSSHPHWASWAPIGERLAFHVPDRFGELRFAP
ncbi:MAG: carbohydrate-binding family 9-like protein [Planctomycetes bacterium]|nr:carbohydrate-binding family 9-like protein [Planctomycetota bacterium]